MNIEKLIFTFTSSSKTKVGSAEERAAMDKLDVRQKCQSKRILNIPFDVFAELHALRTEGHL